MRSASGVGDPLLELIPLVHQGVHNLIFVENSGKIVAGERDHQEPSCRVFFFGQVKRWGLRLRLLPEVLGWIRE